MKAKRILRILLTAFLLLTLVPRVNAEPAYTYYYGGLTITSDTLEPQYISYTAGNIYIKPMSPNPNSYHYLTVSGTTTSDDVTIVIDRYTHADIKLDNVTMIGKYCAIIVSRDTDVGLQLGGTNTFISTGQFPAITVSYDATLSIRPWQGASFLYAKGGPVNPEEYIAF